MDVAASIPQILFKIHSLELNLTLLIRHYLQNLAYNNWL